MERFLDVVEWGSIIKDVFFGPEMRTNRLQAEKLRQQGYSYSEISLRLGIAKSTLSLWFHADPRSQKLRAALTLEAQIRAVKRMRSMSLKAKQHRHALYSRSRVWAKQMFIKFSRDPRFIAGLAIYWGEGDRNVENGNIRVANTDAMLLRAFLIFLITYLGFKRSSIHAYLLLYPDLKEDFCLQYWSRKLRLPKKAFYKSHCIDGRHKTRRLTNGVCTVMVANREKKEVVMKWLLLLGKYLDRAGIAQR